MKNQYFGDKTDYIKHCIMSELASLTFGFAVHWNRTEDDDSSDGKHISYLNAPDIWRHYNPTIFDSIKQNVLAGRRELRVFEELGFVPNTTFCYDLWQKKASERFSSNSNFLNSIGSQKLVFYDPDNGLETKSVHRDGRNSDKYVYFSDVKLAWDRGHSLMIYQHFPRVRRETYIISRLRELSSFCQEHGELISISTSFAAFLYVLQRKHEKEIISTIYNFGERWFDQLKVMRLCRASEMLEFEVSHPVQSKQLELSV